MIRKFDETEQYDTSMKIIFATNNAHKLSEVQAVLGPDFELVTPRSVGITEEIPEQQAPSRETLRRKPATFMTARAATASPTTRDSKSKH